MEGGGRGWIPTFDAESKSAKIPKSHFGEGGREVGIQLPTIDAESKSAKIPKSQFQVGGGGLEFNFPNLLKSQCPISWGGGGLESNFQFLMMSPNLLKPNYQKSTSNFQT